MTKIRKQKRAKKYHYNVNRKRQKKKLSKTNIACQEIKKAWERKKSLKTNLKDMGLCYDPNETLEIPKNLPPDILEMSEVKTEESPPKKAFVVEALEKDAKTPRVRQFRLPKGQFEFLTYLLDKYGEDYKAMARDKKNYYQETWKQIRAKIKVFKGIPEQYNEYLASKQKSENDSQVEKMNPGNQVHLL